MKKIILFNILLIISSLTFAQNIATSISRTSKEFTIGQASSSKIIDAKNGKLLLITNARKHQPNKVQYKPSDYVILNIDTNLHINHKTTLKRSKNKELLAYTSTPTQIILLMRTANRKNSRISRIEIDRESLMIQKETPIDTISFQKRDEVHLWCKSSSDSKYTALTYIVANPSKDKWECNSLMLNNEMSIIWKLEPKTYAINDIFVTDDATLYIVGNHYQIENNSTEFYYEKISVQDRNITTHTENNILLNACILNVINNKMLIAGCTYSYNSPKYKVCTSGMYGMSFNFNTKKTATELYEFSHEDLCVLYNEDVSKKKIPPYIDNLISTNTQPTANGGIITTQRQIWINELSANDNNEYTITNMGLFAINIDTNGHIQWTKPLRHKQSQINGMHYLNHYIFTDHNNTYILQSEDNQSQENYNINNAINTLYPTTQKANIVIYKIEEDGQTEKQILLYNTKATINGECKQWYKNHLYYIIGNNKECKLLTISK